MMNQNMGQPVNVQPAQFSAFAGGNLGNYQPENIDLIMDVPLQVTVELGRTTKSISDILDLGPGKIIELNKLAGEPIDVLVNGKYVAKGEVVVIEESFESRKLSMLQEQAESRNRHDKCVTDRFSGKLYTTFGCTVYFCCCSGCYISYHQMDGRYAAWTPVYSTQ